MSDYVCAGCGVEFSRPGDRPYTYCSRQCFHAARVGKPGPRAGQVRLITRTCRRCGDRFQTRNSAGARINYCSRWCQTQATSRALPVRDMSVPQLAYLAGLIDGEGTVVVQDRRASRPGSTHPSVALSIAGSHMPMHQWLITTTGTGSISSFEPNIGTKVVHQWRVQAERAVAVLRQCLPYLIEKKDRAQRAIDAYERGYAVLDETPVTEPSGPKLSG